MIGGSDKVLWVPKSAKAADVILRVVRRHWPKYVFQNADDDAPEPAQPSALPAPTGREFFLYRDRNAAKAWLKSGATAKNKNTLIYVILGKDLKPARGLRSITLVATDWTGALAKCLADIEAEFDALSPKTQSNAQTVAVHSSLHSRKQR